MDGAARQQTCAPLSPGLLCRRCNSPLHNQAWGTSPTWEQTRQPSNASGERESVRPAGGVWGGAQDCRRRPGPGRLGPGRRAGDGLERGRCVAPGGQPARRRDRVQGGRGPRADAQHSPSCWPHADGVLVCVPGPVREGGWRGPRGVGGRRQPLAAGAPRRPPPGLCLSPSRAHGVRLLQRSCPFTRSGRQ